MLSSLRDIIFFSINRRSKQGGGFTFYIKSTHSCEIVKNMSFALENIMECITIEIKCEKSKNIIINCVYRAPGSNTIFEDKLTKI